MNTWIVLKETSLPSIDKFFSTLTNSGISKEDYEHAQKVWVKFKIKNLWEYTMLYLKTDVLLLADIFENFREICLKHYKLDPLNFLTAPSLSWNAMLKSTDVKIHLIVEIAMLAFIQRHIRGGLVQCSQKLAEANNKFIKNFKDKDPSSFIVYVDVNNLYGYGLSEPLPIRNFKMGR